MAQTKQAIRWFSAPFEKQMQVIYVGRVSAGTKVMGQKIKGKLARQRRAPAALIEKTISLQYPTLDGLVRRVITTSKLANAWEWGGILRPRGKTGSGKKGAAVLAIPMGGLGPPRDKPYMSKAEKASKRVVVVGKKAYLVDKQTDEFTHVLKERVRVSPHPFMRPGFNSAIPAVRRIMEAPVR